MSDTAVVTLTGLTKAYGSTQALRHCSITLNAGEVHAVVGENGSGKSTTVKLLTGIATPDQGTIDIGGVVRTALSGPQEAMSEGVVGVFQNMMVVDTQSVLDNVWLGADGVMKRNGDLSERRPRAAAVLEELLGKTLDLDAEAQSLPLSERQTLGIARALLREPKVLILDEATSALDIATRNRLFAILKRLAAGGTAIVFISHRMDEIEEIGDQITIMRGGETIATVRRGEIETSEVLRLMAGAEREERAEAHEWLTAHRARDASAAQPVLRTNGLKLHDEGDPIDEAFLQGELVGVAGLEGHGQEQFLKALAGARAHAGTVSVLAGGEAVVRSKKHAYRLGVAYVPRDRQTDGIFETLSINDNFALATMGEDRGAGLLSRSRTRRRLAGYVDSLKIKLADPADPISTLSGGNQQKVVLARWLAAGPKVLLLDDPTRGIDPGAKRDLYELLARLTADGLTVIMVSTDVDELVQMADRVIVFREGAVHTQIPHDQLNRHALVSSFFGR